jgi:hypothetical protein
LRLSFNPTLATLDFSELLLRIPQHNNPPGRAGVYLGRRRVNSGYGPEAPMAC